ncbi:MAG: hypothetical protein PHG44_03785, partial [Lentisphaeria bacterium]|nr:hypothetical protein [Lentisphaeria bacterium]
SAMPKKTPGVWGQSPQSKTQLVWCKFHKTSIIFRSQLRDATNIFQGSIEEVEFFNAALGEEELFKLIKKKIPR